MGQLKKTNRTQQSQNIKIKQLCIKVGRGQGDGDMGTRVWGLGDARQGTYGHQVWDAATCGTGMLQTK